MTKLTLEDYVGWLYRKLGGPTIMVENQDKLPDIVNDSLEELKEHLTYNKFVTVPYANRIDLSQYKVRSIIQVYRTQAMGAAGSTNESTDAFLLSAGMVVGMPYNLNGYANLLLTRRIKNTIQTDLDYRWDSPFLYIIQNAQQGTQITIEYSAEVSSVEEITDDWWIGKLRKLALANAKIDLGRVRSKYRLANALYENDGAQILQEGLQERKEIMDFLENNHDIILPIGS